MSFKSKLLDLWRANLDQNPKSLSIAFGIMASVILLFLMQTVYLGTTIGIWDWTNLIGEIIWALGGFGMTVISIMTGADVKEYRLNHTH